MPCSAIVARIENATIVGEYDRDQWTTDGHADGERGGRGPRTRRWTTCDQAIARAGDAPARRERSPCAARSRAMRETFTNITAGLVVAVVVIFLLLAANFQSLRLAFVVVSTVPAVLRAWC